MEPGSRSSDEGRSNAREWPNPKGLELQKRMPHEHIASMLNAVENAFQNGRRNFEGKELRASKFCRIEFPSAWRWKGRHSSRSSELGKPARTAVLSTRYRIACVMAFKVPCCWNL